MRGPDLLAKCNGVAILARSFAHAFDYAHQVDVTCAKGVDKGIQRFIAISNGFE